MASYAQDVKNELAHKFDAERDCLLAEFVALLKVGTITSSNVAVVRRIVKLIYSMGGRG